MCMVDKIKSVVGDQLVSIDQRSIQSVKQALQHGTAAELAAASTCAQKVLN